MVPQVPVWAQGPDVCSDMAWTVLQQDLRSTVKPFWSRGSEGPDRLKSSEEGGGCHSYPFHPHSPWAQDSCGAFVHREKHDIIREYIRMHTSLTFLQDLLGPVFPSDL